MANIPYQASSIIAGVSTRPYALRRDGHAIEQENCLLSTQHGLTKRPGTTFQQVIEGGTTYVDDGVFMHPLNHDGKERVLVISSATSVQVFDKDGKKFPVTHFPSTDSRIKTAWLKYRQLMTSPNTSTGASTDVPIKNLDPRRMSATTLGDVTWICADNVKTEMGTNDSSGTPSSWDKWVGAQGTVNDPTTGRKVDDATVRNEDHFSIWVRSIVPTTDPRSHSITAQCALDSGTTAPYIRPATASVSTRITTDDDPTTTNIDVNTASSDPDARFSKTSTTEVAGHLAYELGDMVFTRSGNDPYQQSPAQSIRCLQATTLDTQGYGTPSGDLNGDGTSCIMGLHCHKIEGGYLSGLNLGGSTGSTGGTTAGDNWATVCWQEVPSLSDLPPNSWVHHTVKVGSSDVAGGFYARFVSDDRTIKGMNNNAITSTTSWSPGDSSNNNEDNSEPQVTYNVRLPRHGHWEEYCSVGTNRKIKSRSMPQLLIRRPDDSYALMEARGEFAINDQNHSTYFYSAAAGTVQGQNASEGWILINAVDAGFSSPIDVTGPPSGGDPWFSGNPTQTLATNDSDVKPLVPGDTIYFKAGDSGGTFSPAYFPPELELDTTYYVVDAVPYTSAAGVAWGDSTQTAVTRRVLIRIAKTKDGTPITYSDGQPNASDAWRTYVSVHLTTYAGFEWSLRESGDDDSNPVPGFMGRPIKSIFNFQDRIGFLSEGQITFSGTGDYFNLFRSTVRDLIASDAFTLAPSTEMGEVLQHAIPYDRQLVAVSNRAQFVVTGENGFSPTTASITKVSQTPSSFGCRPVVVGDGIFMAYEQEDATGIYNIQQSSTVSGKFDTVDVTEDIPGYLPLGAVKMVGSEKHNMLFLLANGDGEPGLGEPAATYQNLYVYSWAKRDRELVHSAWTTWKFGDKLSADQSDYRIKNMLLQGDRLYLVVSTPVNYPATIWEDSLEYIDLDITSRSKASQRIQDDFGKPCLDRLSVGGSGYQGATDQSGGTEDRGIYSIAVYGGSTTIKLKWPLTENSKNNLVIVRDNGIIYDTIGTGEGQLQIDLAFQSATIGQGDPTGLLLPRVIVNNVNLLDHQNFYIGLKYPMISRYGPFVPIVQEQSLGGRNIFVRAARLTYSQAHAFDVNIHQDKLYTHAVSAVPSDFVENYLEDPEDVTGLGGSRWNTQNAHWSTNIRYREIRNYALSPTGTKTADYIEVIGDPDEPSVAGGTDQFPVRVGNVTQDVVLTATTGQDYTYSMYIKKPVDPANLSQIIVYLIDGIGGGTTKEQISFTYKQSTDFYHHFGQVTQGSSDYTTDNITITDVNEDWYRLAVTLTDHDGDAVTFRVRHYPKPDIGDKFLVLWGGQLVKQDTAAPYYSPVPLITGDSRFTVRKKMTDLDFELKNTSPWNSKFQVLHYDLAVQDIV